MSDCETACLGSEEGHGHMTICRPRFRTFVVRVRMAGERRYEIVGTSRSRRKAYRMLADAMEAKRYKRGDVLGDEGPGSYYEPTLLVEMVS